MLPKIDTLDGTLNDVSRLTSVGTFFFSMISSAVNANGVRPKKTPRIRGAENQEKSEREKSLSTSIIAKDFSFSNSCETRKSK